MNNTTAEALPAPRAEAIAEWFAVRVRSRAVLLITLLLLGHSFGVGYLQLYAERDHVGGTLVSALEPGDAYATIEWDEFVYYPRAIAVSEGWWPLDPWMRHEGRPATWGVLPPLPALMFGLLTRATGDLHLALYVATVVSTILLGWLVVSLFAGPGLGLPWQASVIAALLFVKMPWLGVKAYQLLPLGAFARETLRPFVLGRPLDALTDVEAGLFTYVPYTLFIVLFWKAALDRRLRTSAAAGAAAGLLVYVYFYHYIFAFALLAAWSLVAAARRDWHTVRAGAIGLGVGLACAVPFFVNLSLLARIVSVAEYTGRLGVEPGRFAAENLLFLIALMFPWLLGCVYARQRRRTERVPPALAILAAMTIAYVGVLNLRVALGYDVQSDHYWRQSLGLPATMWVLVVGADLLRMGANEAARRRAVLIATIAVLGVVLFGVVKNTTLWLSPQSQTTPPSPLQRDMIARMALVRAVARPGDVLVTSDVATAYHAVVNARTPPFVPFVHALMPEAEIVRRFFLAQYLTGTDPLSAPRGFDGRPRQTSFPVTSEQKYLFGTYEAQPGTVVHRMLDDVPTGRMVLPVYPMPRADVILVPTLQQGRARERIARDFDIVAEQQAGGFIAMRVAERMKANGTNDH